MAVKSFIVQAPGQKYDEKNYGFLLKTVYNMAKSVRTNRIKTLT
jgi:hypothetical protein